MSSECHSKINFKVKCIPKVKVGVKVISPGTMYVSMNTLLKSNIV